MAVLGTAFTPALAVEKTVQIQMTGVVPPVSSPVSESDLDSVSSWEFEQKFKIGMYVLGGILTTTLMITDVFVVLNRLGITDLQNSIDGFSDNFTMGNRIAMINNSDIQNNIMNNQIKINGLNQSMQDEFVLIREMLESNQLSMSQSLSTFATGTELSQNLMNTTMYRELDLANEKIKILEPCLDTNVNVEQINSNFQTLESNVNLALGSKMDQNNVNDMIQTNLDTVIANFTTALDGKANSADMATALGLMISTLDSNSADMTTALDLKANVADMTTALDLKANVDDMTTSLDLKANVVDMTTALDLKANAGDMTTALDLKANMADMTTALDLKATVEALNTVIANVENNAQDIATLTTRLKVLKRVFLE